MGLDIRGTPAKRTRWFGLVASSMVVLFASVRIFRNDDVRCGDDASTLAGTEFCKRTRLGISLGVLTFLASLAFSFGGTYIPFAGLLELALTSILLVMWIFGVGFITFGGDLSPGTHIGNLYFSTWISFGLVVRKVEKRMKMGCLVRFCWAITSLTLSFFFFLPSFSFFPQVTLFSTAFRDFVGGPSQSTTSSDVNGDPDLGNPAPAPAQIPDEDDI